MSPPPLVARDEYNLALENSNFDGVMLTGIAYGINVVLVALAAHQLWIQERNIYLSRALLIVLGVMFVLSTLTVVGNTNWVQRMFVDAQDYPGGPDAFYWKEYTSPAKFMSTVSFFLSVMLYEGLIAYRCMALYTFQIWQILLQGLIFLCCLAAGAFLIAYETLHHADAPVNACIIFLVLMLLMDLELTAFIVGRFIYYRWLVGGASGGSILIWLQSAVLSGAFGIAFLITTVAGNPMSGLFLVVQGQVNTIATALVMLRIAWAKNHSMVESHSESSEADDVSQIIFIEGRPTALNKPEDSHISWQAASAASE